MSPNTVEPATHLERRGSFAIVEVLSAGSDEAVALLDREGTPLYIGDATAAVLGYPPEVVAGMRPKDVVHPDDLPSFEGCFAALAAQEGATQSILIRVRRSDGRYHLVRCHLANAMHVRGLRAIVVRVAARPDTDSSGSERWISEPQFRAALQRALGRSRGDPSHGFGVIALRVEHFARVEAGLGSESANQLVTEIGQRIAARLPEGTLLMQRGRGELAVLLDRCADAEAATAFADAAAGAVKGAVLVGGVSVPCSVVAGVASSHRGYDDPDDILRDAWAAVSRAGGGRRRAVFQTNMRSEERAYLSLLGDLDGAIARDELLVHYQPIVAMATGQVAGYEALVRWQHPARGLVTPATFIPLAEESGQIHEIGAWVLDRACRDIVALNRARSGKPPMFVSVNLSAVQLRAPDLAAEIQATLDRTGASPALTKLEVTETAILTQTELALETLRQLRARGIQIALDDFGTGYSSLTMLGELPLDMLKIDRSFVSRLEHDPNAFAIVQALVVLAANLRLKVVGEGVETSRQRALLWSLQCDFAQGYLFGKPAVLATP